MTGGSRRAVAAEEHDAVWAGARTWAAVLGRKASVRLGRFARAWTRAEARCWAAAAAPRPLRARGRALRWAAGCGQDWLGRARPPASAGFFEIFYFPFLTKSISISQP